MLFCMVMRLSGRVIDPQNGFAVDTVGKVYIGDTKKIYVYEQGVCVDTIDPQTNRAYLFTVIDGNKILLSTARYIYTLDLMGEVLSKTPDLGTAMYNQLNAHKGTFVAGDGTVYVAEYPMGRFQITDGSRRIYQLPVLDYIVEMLYDISFICTMVFALYIAIRRLSHILRFRKTGGIKTDTTTGEESFRSTFEK